MTASLITRPPVRSMLRRIAAASTSSPSTMARACLWAPAMRQHDPLDLPGAGGAFVVGDHGVHQGGGVLAHHGDRGVDVAAGDRVALLRHGGRRAAAVREGLVDLAD